MFNISINNNLIFYIGNTMEQLNEDKGEDEYYEGNSKKRNWQNCPLSYKILIVITVASLLLSLCLIYSSFSKKNSADFYN